MLTMTMAAEAARHEDFRTVLHTGRHTQVVAMTLRRGEAIGTEVHPDNDQILIFTEGAARVEVSGSVATLAAGDLVVVPAGARHDVTNTGAGPLRLVTVYGPPAHPPYTVHRTKADAELAEHARA